MNLNTPFELTIRAKEKSWCERLIDGTSTKDFILLASSGKKLRADHFFEVIVGNNKGNQITLNGKPFELPIPEDNIVKNYLIQRSF